MSAVVAVLVAAVAAFLLSGAYYGVLGGRLARWSPAYATPRSPATTAVVEVVRNVVLAAVLRGLLGDEPVGPALLVALGLWLAFPAVLLTGSVWHERTDPRLAVVHAGDWLLKLPALALVVALWP